MLEVNALNQYYGGSHILRDVELTAPHGKLTVLLGRNGVGKTTLLRCLTGTVHVQSGSLAWRGTSLTKLSTYERVALGLGYVPQGRDIFPRLTVEENLLVGAASKKRRQKFRIAFTHSFRCSSECARAAAATSPGASSNSSLSAGP